MAEEAERCRRTGMDAHVAKSIDWTQLFATIDHLCVSTLGLPRSGASLRRAGRSGTHPRRERPGHPSLTARPRADRRTSPLLSSGGQAPRCAGGAAVSQPQTGNRPRARPCLARWPTRVAELSLFCVNLEDAALRGDVGGPLSLGGSRGRPRRVRAQVVAHRPIDYFRVA